MNNTDKIKKHMLDNFATQAFGKTLSIKNIFVERENEALEKFNKVVIDIPWYLKLFSGVIIKIAYSSFKDGLSENCTDTVTFKRPNQYKANK